MPSGSSPQSLSCSTRLACSQNASGKPMRRIETPESLPICSKCSMTAEPKPPSGPEHKDREDPYFFTSSAVPCYRTAGRRTHPELASVVGQVHEGCTACRQGPYRQRRDGNRRGRALARWTRTLRVRSEGFTDALEQRFCLGLRAGKSTRSRICRSCGSRSANRA